MLSCPVQPERFLHLSFRCLPCHLIIEHKRNTTNSSLANTLTCVMSFVPCRELPSSRQTTLLETLAAAASLLTPAEKTRPGAGPPPLLSFLRPLRPAPHLAAHTIDFAAVRGPAEQASVTAATLSG